MKVYYDLATYSYLLTLFTPPATVFFFPLEISCVIFSSIPSSRPSLFFLQLLIYLQYFYYYRSLPYRHDLATVTVQCMTQHAWHLLVYFWLKFALTHELSERLRRERTSRPTQILIIFCPIHESCLEWESS